MNRPFRKIAVFTVALAMTCPLFLAGCMDSQQGLEKLDPTRTQLYVQNYKGGYGSDWLYAVKVRFEKEYADREYESGKKGVQIMISPAKEDGISLINKVSDTTNEVFFNESVYYYEYLKKDLLLDITDAVEEKMTMFGEQESIEDKLSEEQISYYKVDGKKYYGIPHYAGYNSIMYNVNVFDEYCLYFADTNDHSFISDLSQDKSAGPDGEYGTSDDGLPSTYDEFFLLCDYMVELGLTPIVWPGQYYNSYIEKVINAFYADDVGLDQMMLNYTFKGRAKNILDTVAEDGSYEYLYGEEGVDITSKNAYLLWASEGRYNSLSFFEKLVKNTSYYPKLCFSPSYLYTDSPKDFLESVPKGEPICMLVEGCWWENEQKDVIKQIADYYGQEYSLENSRFAMMPIPKSSEEKIGMASTIVDTHYSLGFISASIAPFKQELAKEFLMFCCTDRSLAEFTVTTNTVKALDYDLTQEEYAQLTYFGKSVYDLHKKSDIVYPFSAEEVYLGNQSALSVHETFGSKIGTKEELHPIGYFHENQANNAIDYFNGMLVYNMERWDRVFGGYFD